MSLIKLPGQEYFWNVRIYWNLPFLLMQTYSWPGIVNFLKAGVLSTRKSLISGIPGFRLGTGITHKVLTVQKPNHVNRKTRTNWTENMISSMHPVLATE
jgi:hypothetical protein